MTNCTEDKARQEWWILEIFLKFLQNFYRPKALAQFNNDANAAALSILTSQMAG